MSLHICKAICLDEIDRSYLSELNRLFSFFSHTHQTLLFHSSFQSAMLEDTRKWLSDPIVINATQRDEIRCDIQYDVEYVKENERNVFIVRSCLNKTAPPVLIVCRSEKNVDFLHEYFLLKGIDTVSMTSSMSPQEKSRALQTFRDKKADVLVCTDSSLGAESLPEVRHVIHFDLPSESRFFVNRLKSLRPKGISTALIGSSTPQDAVVNMKLLLVKIGQSLPEWLLQVKDNSGIPSVPATRCLWCGSRYHRIVNCPQL